MGINHGQGHWRYAALTMIRPFKSATGGLPFSIACDEVPMDVADDILGDLSPQVDDFEFSDEDLDRLETDALYEWCYDKYGEDWFPVGFSTFTETEEFLEFLGLCVD